MQMTGRPLSTRSISIVDILFSLIISMSFLLHFFLYTTSGIFYLILFASLVILYIVIKPVLLNNDTLIWPWIISAVAIWCSYYHSTQAKSTMIDVAVLTIGVLLIVFPSRNAKTYFTGIKVIRFFAFFFALGVWLQVLASPLYNLLIGVFPASYANQLRNLGDANVGFSLNVGFTAGYIVAGILATLSFPEKAKKKWHYYSYLLFLLIALFLTGKRGHSIFLLGTFLICAILPVRGNEKMRKYWYSLVVGIILVAIYFIFYDFLLQIPVINRLILTIDGLINGVDTTTGRTNLHARALQLFRENLVFGIGWGEFRSTTTGNFRIFSNLDAHNIFLQVMCETGIIGTVCIFLAIILFWVASKNAYKECICQTDMELRKWKPILYYSFAYQSFFLFYGLTGNPLYDQHYQIMYMVACSMLIAYRMANRHMNIIRR